MLALNIFHILHAVSIRTQNSRNYVPLLSLYHVNFPQYKQLQRHVTQNKFVKKTIFSTPDNSKNT